MNDAIDIDPMDLAIKNALNRALKDLEALNDFCANPPPDMWDSTSGRFRTMAIAKMLGSVVLNNPHTDAKVQKQLLWLANEMHKLIPDRPDSLKQHDADMEYWLSYMDSITNRYIEQ